jgi:hypothetical protein
MITTERRIDGEEFYCRFIAPEERKNRWTSPWDGGFRWFESNNVVALERYRPAEEWQRIRERFWSKRK